MKESKLIKLAQKEYNNLQYILYTAHHDNKVSKKYRHLFLEDIIHYKQFYGFIMKKQYKKAYRVLSGKLDELCYIPRNILDFLINTVEKI
jgi:hypothetical protein